MPTSHPRIQDAAGKEVRPEDVIRLDRTRTRWVPGPDGKPMAIPDMSEVHGDMTPEDPHFRVAFFQDTLPFDNNGKLVPDDGRKEPWQGLDNEGKPKLYRPLYNAQMRAIVLRKMTRIQSNALQHLRAPALDDLHEDRVEREQASEEINIADWLAGDADYQPWLVCAAVEKRWGKRFDPQDISPMIDFLVNQALAIQLHNLRSDFRRYMPSRS